MEIDGPKLQPDGSYITNYKEVFSKEDKKNVLDRAIKWVSDRILTQGEAREIDTMLNGSVEFIDGTLISIVTKGQSFEQTHQRVTNSHNPDREGEVVFLSDVEIATVVEKDSIKSPIIFSRKYPPDED